MTAIRAVTPADPVRPAAKPAALGALARLRTPGANLSDREFLAPALEILETPPSPVHVAFLWTICAFVLAALVWAYLGHVDIVAAAQGKFQPTGRVKVVEPLETGRVEDIRVANGSLVKAGDVLIELDRASAEADVEGARAELSSARAEILRRKAALVAAQAHTFDSPPKIDWPDGVAPGLREREEQVLAADLGQLAATQASFAAERAQKTAERDKLGETIATQKNLVATLKERVDMRTKLVEEKAGAKAAVIDATETLQYQITQQAKQEQELASLSAGLEVISRDADKAVQAFVSDDAEKLDDAERRVEDVEQRFAKAQAELDRLTLRAPIAGRVQSSIITNVGQVVASGQEIMRIVPETSGLEIEAYVRNRDIGFVSVGQEAVVKVEILPLYALRSDSCPRRPHRQGRHPRARRRGDRGRSCSRFCSRRLCRRRTDPEPCVPGRAQAGRRDDYGRRRCGTAHLGHGGHGRAQDRRSADARIPLRPPGRSRLKGDAGTVRRGTVRSPVAFSARLLDRLPKKSHDADEAQGEKHGSQVRDSRPIDDGVRQSEPEIAHRPEGRHPIRLAGQLNNDHQGGERGEAFDGVEIGAVSALTPQRDGAGRGVHVVFPRQGAVRDHLAGDIGNPQRRRKHCRQGEVPKVGCHGVPLPAIRLGLGCADPTSVALRRIHPSSNKQRRTRAANFDKDRVETSQIFRWTGGWR